MTSLIASFQDFSSMSVFAFQFQQYQHKASLSVDYLALICLTNAIFIVSCMLQFLRIHMRQAYHFARSKTTSKQQSLSILLFSVNILVYNIGMSDRFIPKISRRFIFLLKCFPGKTLNCSSRTRGFLPGLYLWETIYTTPRGESMLNNLVYVGIYYNFQGSL